MEKFVLVSFSLLLISLSSVCYQGLAAEETKKYYCVAKPSTNDETLQLNINEACKDPNVVNCKVIQKGGACFQPDTRINQASVVMNIYYQANNRSEHACYFNNTGLITITDPSYDNCKYPY